ncbi:hypothetical protein T492DRAFT_857387 [Pavlovales sp. CCMP2436]|nr:hypothetical protein T492DRAFT_857387 [Pavlovales sp. CCMP2436]
MGGQSSAAAPATAAVPGLRDQVAVAESDKEIVPAAKRLAQLQRLANTAQHMADEAGEEGFPEPIVEVAQIVSFLRCHHSGHKDGQLSDPVSGGPPALIQVGRTAAGVPKLDSLSRVRSPVDLTVADYKASPNAGLDHRTLTLCGCRPQRGAGRADAGEDSQRAAGGRTGTALGTGRSE